MFTINIRSNVNQIVAEFRDIGRRRVNTAIKVAINSTAHAVRQAEVEEMRRTLDRPTPYTLRSLYIKYATEKNQRAIVWLKDDGAGKGTVASKYLAPQIEGGTRRQKRFERALSARGLLPSGMFAVPGSGAKLDAYGNMSRGLIGQILSALGSAETKAGYSANRTAGSIKRRGKKLAQFFVGRPGKGLPLGVWQRFQFARGSAIKPVLIFVKGVSYHPRFNYFDVADRVVAAEMPRRLRDAFNAVRAASR